MPNPNIDVLVAEVAEDVTVKASAITLIEGFAARIATIQAELAALGIDNATLNTLSSDLDTSTNALAAAVTANTPAA